MKFHLAFTVMFGTLLFAGCSSETIRRTESVSVSPGHAREKFVDFCQQFGTEGFKLKKGQYVPGQFARYGKCKNGVWSLPEVSVSLPSNSHTGETVLAYTLVANEKCFGGYLKKLRKWAAGDSD